MPDSTAAGTRLIDDELFIADSHDVILRGAQCARCETTTFPYQHSCPRCGGVDMASVPLPRAGRLWSFTVQSFEPKPPFRCDGEFEPYGVGYVDLGPVIVEARLTEHDVTRLSIDAAMELTLIPAFRDGDGATVLTYGFASVGERS